MKALLLLTFIVSSAYAGTQTRHSLTNPVLSMKNQELNLSGIVKSKSYNLDLVSIIVRGVVAGKTCGADNCLGTLSKNNRGEVILNARIDVDNDGQIDGRESKVVGIISHDDIIDLRINAKYELIQDRYTWLERLSGLKDRDYGAVTFSL